MPKGYWIVHIKVSDPDTYSDYANLAPPIVKGLGGRYVVDAGRGETVEGDEFLDRHGVVEFPSYKDARAAFHSESYQSVVHLRHASSVCLFTIAEGD